MNESDAFSIIKSLGKYLHTKVEREEGIIKIIVSNNAPVKSNWPFVAFTGVGIAYNPNKWMSSHERMKRFTGYKVDLSKAPQGGSWSELEDKQHFLKVDIGKYPMLTSDESKHGYSLFPGQSIVFEMNMTIEDLKDFRVEGTLSRRHLFHFTKELIP